VESLPKELELYATTLARMFGMFDGIRCVVILKQIYMKKNSNRWHK
jgi:hypothetical protein